MTHDDKDKLKRELVAALAGDQQVEKIIIFGSFTQSVNPHDMDVAVFCNSQDDYLTLALALRKKLRSLARTITIDLLPITIPYDPASVFMKEIIEGDVVYEKRH